MRAWADVSDIHNSRQHINTHLPLLNDEAFVDAWFEHFHHLRITHIVTDVFKNVLVRDDTQRPEHNPDRDVVLDVR